VAGRKVQLARPASSSNVTLCERQNPGAPELTRARTADDLVASSLLAPPRKQCSFSFLGRGARRARSAAQNQPCRRGKPADQPSFSAACADPGAPSPAPNSHLSHPTPLGSTRTAPRARCGIDVSALRTAPGRPGPFGLTMASVQQGEKQLFEKFWRGTFKAVATPRPESIIVASITARKPLPR
jgi:hypothetical protein